MASVANLHARLLTKCFQKYPVPESPVRNGRSSMPPDLNLVKRSGRGGTAWPAVDKEPDHPPKNDSADVLFDEGYEKSSQPQDSQVWLPGSAGHRGDLIGQGQQTCVFGDTERINLIQSCIRPNLKDLSLDIYIEERVHE